MNTWITFCGTLMAGCGVYSLVRWKDSTITTILALLQILVGIWLILISVTVASGAQTTPPAVILWAVWLTNFHDGEALGPAKPITPEAIVFTSREQCERYKEEQLALMESKGLVKRIGKDKTEWKWSVPSPMIGVWECKPMEAKEL